MFADKINYFLNVFWASWAIVQTFSLVEHKILFAFRFNLLDKCMSMANIDKLVLWAVDKKNWAPD